VPTGVSCHTLGALQAAAATDWVEVDLVRLNPAGRHMDAPSHVVIPIIKEMRSKGKGIIGMKILAQGDLRSKADEAIQYALAQDAPAGQSQVSLQPISGLSPGRESAWPRAVGASFTRSRP
jgi:hypothetical protein